MYFELIAYASSNLIGAIVTFLGFKSYFPSYMAKKGENLATKEDIGKITHEIEKVRLNYAAELEGQRGWHQLRIAAMERRLEAHQQAYSWARKLWSNCNNVAELGKVALDCGEWWDKNCLFLSREAFEIFNYARAAAIDIITCQSDGSVPQDSEERKQRIENKKVLREAAKKICETVELPSLDIRDFPLPKGSATDVVPT